MVRTKLATLASLVFLLHLCLVAGGFAAEQRTWVSADGKYKVDATLLAAEEDSVRLQRADGVEITVPLNKLSEDNRAYVDGYMKAAREAESEDDVFVVEDVMTIASPGGGFEWKRVKDFEAQGVKGMVLVCSKEGSKTAITVVAELRKAATDAERTAAVKGNYNGLITTLQQAGFTELKASKPALDPPIKELVAFIVSGKKPDGSPAELRAASVFGENTYSYQVISEDADEATQLLQLVGTLKELD